MKQAIGFAFILMTLACPAVAATTLAERLGYPRDAKLLIVHGDDLGMAHSVNAASIKALQTGLVTSGSIMVPGPWFPEIAAYARAHPEADLGLHLTLTSEWTTLRWRPLLRLPSLVDPTGYLYLTETEAAAHIKPKEADAEIRAQIERARASGIRPTHLDSHMGTLYQNKDLFKVLMRVAREQRLPVRVTRTQAETPFIAAVLKPDDIIIDRVISIGDDVPAEGWVAYYSVAIEKLEPGVSEFIIHLAYDDDEMRAATFDHPGWGAAWRQRDFDFFTSDAFRRLLRENHITLITWRDLATLIGARP